MRDDGFEGFVGRIDYLGLIKTGVEDSHGEPVRINYEIEGDLPEHADIYLEIADEKSFSKVSRYSCSTKPCEVYNLYIGRCYYWRVGVNVDGNTLIMSQTACFVTENIAPRMIKAEKISNIRDLGEWKTVDGRHVRQDLLFRESEFDSYQTLTPQSKHVLLGKLNL
ncbi:MAG: tyrosine-protein phosphatase [Clostridia bacterium]|nr:tyrosine-protein phosphatase [Clostridia bacterium]